MKVTLALVAYRSSRVLPPCIKSFRREAERAGVEAEVVVVDHSEDPAEVRAISSLNVDRVLPRPNRGFAAGVNLAVANSSGEYVLIANPDIEFLPGSLSGLLEATSSEFTVAGPQLVWDPGGIIRLPIPEDPSPLAELVRALRRRNRIAWGWGLNRYIEILRLHWEASGPLEVPSLRGPALMLSRNEFFRIGPWNEGYFLYFEETEWLLRARRRGARLALAGGARVRHAWGDSTRHLEDSTVLEARSRRRFIARNYPAWWRLAIRCVGGAGEVGARAWTVSGPEAVGPVDAAIWLLSPWPHLIPAAGWLGGDRPPVALKELTAAGRWYLAAADRGRRGWEIVAAWTWSAA